MSLDIDRHGVYVASVTYLNFDLVAATAVLFLLLLLLVGRSMSHKQQKNISIESLPSAALLSLYAGTAA